MSTSFISGSRLLAAVALSVVTAACSGGAANTGSSSSSPSAGPVAATAMPATTSTGKGTGIDVCALLPADQVAQITGLTIATAKPHTSVLVPNASGCIYGQGNVVVVHVLPTGGAAQYNALLAQFGTNPTPVTGFGDKAFQDSTDGVDLVALFGDTEFDTFIEAEGSQQLNDEGITRVSEALITALKGNMQ